MIRAIRPTATADAPVDWLRGWNVAPNGEYQIDVTPGASNVGVILSRGGTIVATGGCLPGTDQPVMLAPTPGQALDRIDADLHWHLLISSPAGPASVTLAAMVDLPDEIHPIYQDDALALSRATGLIDHGTHITADITVTCPLGLGAGLGAVVAVPVDGQTVTGQVESITWAATPDGAMEQAVIRQHIPITPAATTPPPAPPVVADDTGATDAATTTSGNVLANDDPGLAVVAVNGLSARVGQVVTGSNGGDFVIGSNGAWTFDPSGDFAGLTGSDTATTSATYHASDGTAEAMGTLTVTVSSGASPALWTPAEITTAQWLDAADSSTFTLDGSAVTQWRDKSGNGRHVSQDTPAARPQLASTPPRVVFDGSNDALLSSAFDFPRPFSVFFVGSNSAASYRRAVHVGVSSDTNAFIGANGGNYATFFGNVSGFWVDVAANSPSKTVSVPRIFGLTNAGSGATDAVPYADGVAQNAKGGGTFSGNGKGVCIGANPTGAGQEWQGTIYEEIILPSVASADLRQKIEGYLAHKWDALLGVTTLVDALPTGHPYKSVAPTL